MSCNVFLCICGKKCKLYLQKKLIMTDDISTDLVEENQDLMNQGQIINELMDECEENESDDEEQESPYVCMETFKKDFFFWSNNNQQ